MYMYTHKYEVLADFNLAVAKVDCHTEKIPGYTVYMQSSKIHLEPHIVLRLHADFRMIVRNITASQETVDSLHVGATLGTNEPFVNELHPLLGGRGQTTVLALHVLLKVASKLRQ